MGISIKKTVVAAAAFAAIGGAPVALASTANAAPVDSGSVSAQGVTRTSVKAVPRTVAPKFDGPSSRFAELQRMFSGGPSKFGQAQQECGLIKANNCLRR